MDRIDPHRRLLAVVGDLEETELANEMRAEILQDETLVAEVRPGVAQRAVGIAVAGDVRKPLAIFRSRLDADPLDVLHHGEAERVGIDAAIARVVEGRLKDDARM